MPQSGILGGVLCSAPMRVLALVVLFTGAAVYEAYHLSSFAAPGVWWQLRTGLWMLQTHSVPHNGLFSQYPSYPWMASSWGYSILLGAAYNQIGLRSIPLLSMGLQVALAVAIFLLALGISRNFWLASLLSVAAQFAIAGLPPEPITCSMILFAIELMLLFQSRRTGDFRPLFWLPPLFVAWANLHLTFVYGLFALVLLLLAATVEDFCFRSELTWLNRPVMPLAPLAAVTTAAAAASMISPYGYHVYGAVFQQAGSGAYRYVAELHAIDFRHPQDYLLLLLAMAAFLSLGRVRSRDVFALSLMISSAMISCAAQHDRWVVALTAVAIVADSCTKAAVELPPFKWGAEKLIALGLAFVIFLAAAAQVPSDRELLAGSIGRMFPVQASNYIRQNQLPQPLLNEYQWGGFLTWYLPQYPVAIDTRTDLYGDDLNLAYFKLVNAYIPVESDPSFARAQTIILRRNSGLAAAIAALPQFSTVYSDDLATVFVRTKGF